MIGAIIGDIVGSRFEFHNLKSKDFEFFHPDCRPTDDTVMTLAVGDALMAHEVTRVTHDHPEGLAGAEIVAALVFLARRGIGRDELREYVETHYRKIDFTLDEIRPSYGFEVSCQGSVPEAIAAFLESTDFVDAIRNAVSIGGDSDTIAAITGSIAEAFYGVPEKVREKALLYLDPIQKKTLLDCEQSLSLVSRCAAG